MQQRWYSAAGNPAFSVAQQQQKRNSRTLQARSDGIIVALRHIQIGAMDMQPSFAFATHSRSLHSDS